MIDLTFYQLPGCKPGPNICKAPSKADFSNGRQGREAPERSQLHDGCYCRLEPCSSPAPIKPIRCLKLPPE